MNRRDALKSFGLAAAGIGLLGNPFANYQPVKPTKKAPMEYKLGKLPARNTPCVRLADYVTDFSVPVLPDGDFGHQSYVSNWQMLGNGPDPSNPPQIPQGVGDCAIAGPFHAEMLWNAVGGKHVNVNTACTLDMYSAITGWDPNNSANTDRGSNVDDVSNYWQKTGLTDADGKVHKIDAWCSLTPGSLEELKYAIYLTDVVGIGLQFPLEWMQATGNGGTWEYIDNPNIEGGHYVLGVGWFCNSSSAGEGYIDLITWGQQQMMSPAGYAEFNDESVAYFSTERLLASGKDLNGFDYQQLLADFHALPST
jgi:hypothetical protein